MIQDNGNADSLIRPAGNDVVGTGAQSSARLIGAHMPTAGGLHKSLLAGKAIGCNAIQLFTNSPRQWKADPLTEAEIATFHEVRAQTEIAFVVAHDSYLINLAAPTPEGLERSRQAFRSELDRAEQLHLQWVVTHAGAHLNQGEEEAVSRLAESLRLILAETDVLQYRVGIALETTAGQGTGLGWRFEQLGQVLREAGSHPRLGICLDTCHIFAAGYDFRDEVSYEQTWAEFDSLIGLDRLKVIHANDSKKPLGSRVDRHEHIGRGEIGIEGFARLAADPRLQHVPMIIETPELDTMHAVNLKRLQKLAAGEPIDMVVTVHFFGHYSDYYGGDPQEMEIASGATVGDLANALAARDPRLAGLERSCRFAVEEEYAGLDARLQDGATVAVLPPMSGG